MRIYKILNVPYTISCSKPPQHLLGSPRKLVKGQDQWVRTPTYPIYKQVTIHLLSIDPDFQREIQVAFQYQFNVCGGIN